MTDDPLALIVKYAFDAHQRGSITRAQLVECVENCVNARSLENGYASEHGLPFPRRWKRDRRWRRSRRSVGEK